MKTFQSILLFIIAVILGCITIPIGIVSSFFILIYKANIAAWWNKLGEYFLIFSIAIDVAGNVALGPLFNLIMIKKNGYKFGNRKETISSVLGKNKKLNTLTKKGLILSNILDKIDPNHVLDSIDNNV
jgi:hypothetical protein